MSVHIPAHFFLISSARSSLIALTPASFLGARSFRENAYDVVRDEVSRFSFLNDRTSDEPFGGGFQFGPSLLSTNHRAQCKGTFKRLRECWKATCKVLLTPFAPFVPLASPLCLSCSRIPVFVDLLSSPGSPRVALDIASLLSMLLPLQHTSFGTKAGMLCYGIGYYHGALWQLPPSPPRKRLSCSQTSAPQSWPAAQPASSPPASPGLQLLLHRANPVAELLLRFTEFLLAHLLAELLKVVHCGC